MDKKTHAGFVKSNYKKIYLDLLEKKYPEKKTVCSKILSKKKISTIDVLFLNELVFGSKMKETKVKNQKYKSYDLQTIHQILTFQTKQGLNNTQLANHFKISRNTVANWKKKYTNEA